MMQYRASRDPNRVVSLMLYAVVLIGALRIVWNLFKPDGWLLWAIDLFLGAQPNGLYYFALACAGVFAMKFWLDTIGPNAVRNALIMLCAFAGSFYLLGILLPS